MESPNTPAGQLTEMIMAKVMEKEVKLETWEYNRIWSSVHDTLDEWLGAAQANHSNKR